MPCSASTAAGVAAAVPTVTAEMPIATDRQKETLDQKPLTPTLSPQAGRGRDPHSGRVRGSALADSLVQPLVIKCTFERRQLLAELFCVRCRGAGIKGFAVAPCLDQSEVIGVPVPLQDVVMQVAVVLTSGLGLRLDQCRGLVLESRKHIDVGEDINRPGGDLALWRGDLETAVLPHSEPIDHRGLQLLPECGRGRGLAVCFGGLFVAPHFDDRKAARPRDLLEYLK